MSESNSSGAVLEVKKNLPENVKQISAALDTIATTVVVITGSFGALSGKVNDTLGKSKLFAQAMKEVEKAVDSAVTQYDALNRFPEVLAHMGYSAGDAAAATRQLSDGIEGLPTSLDSVIANAQKLTAMTGDLDTATETTLALNNAFLANGGSTAEASKGMQAYMDMLSAGKVSAASWTTLQQTMGIALHQTAEAFGFAGASAQRDLYAALQSGNITFDAFHAKILELNGGVGGFADMAQSSSGGVGSAWTDMKNTIAQGMTGVIGSLDSGLSAFGGLSGAITSFGGIVSGVLSGVVAPALEVLASNLDTILPVAGVFLGLWGAHQFGSFISGVAESADMLEKMTGVLGKTIAAKVQDAAQTAILNLLYVQDSLKKGAATVATWANTAATNANTAANNGNIIAMIAYKVAAGAATVAQWLLNAAMNANPIALIIGAVVALTAVFAGLAVGISKVISWITGSKEAYNAAGETIEEYKEKNEELKESLKDSADSYKQNDAAAQASAATTRGMATSLQEAAAGYDGSADSARKMQAKVQMLNEACTGLNLTFDEETGKLSQTADQIDAYIAASEQAGRKTALKDHMTELNQQMANVQAEMIKAEMEIEKWQQQVDAGEMSDEDFIKRKEEMGVTIGELGETMGEISGEMEQYEKAYSDTLAAEKAAQQALLAEQKDAIRALADEYHYSYDDIIADMEKEGIGFAEWTIKNIDMLEENKAAVEGYAAQWGVSTDEILARCAEQGISFEELADRQQAAIGRLQGLYGDLTDASTDMFSTISTESELSVEDMTANLLHNQQAVAEWSENIAALAEMGIDDGLLQTLMEAGPESAGYVKAIVDGGEEEIMKLSDAYAAGADTANEALKTSLGDVDITPEVMDMVTKTEDSLVKQIKDSDFPGIGKSVGEGYAKGIEETQQDVVDSAVKVTEATVEMAKKLLGIHSPSKVFTEIGGNVVQGLAQGIDGNLTAATGSAGKIVNALDIKGPLYASGQNAMQGFNDGLWSMASRVYSTAATIANNVANTINRALQIHSPSRLLRESGRYTMEGFDLGMQDMERGIVATVRGIAGRVTHEMQAAAMSGNGVDAVYHTDVSYSDAATAGLLEKLIAAVRDGQVIRLDTGALVGATAGAYDVSLGNTKLYSERWRR